MPLPSETWNSLFATVAMKQCFWAMVLLMLLEAESLEVIMAQVALNKNFTTNFFVGFHVPASEGLTTRVARCRSMRANHDVVRKIRSLIGIVTHRALHWESRALFLMSLHAPFWNNGATVFAS